MNTLTKTFENSDIRVAKIDNQFWWNLKDVCIALGMATGSEKKLKKRHGANHFQLVSFRHPLNGKIRVSSPLMAIRPNSNHEFVEA